MSATGATWLAARLLSKRLISARGLAPAPEGRAEFFDELRRRSALAADLRFPGASRSPAALAALFASPGNPSSRPTILFLHGKGGASVEWRPDAFRALELGYNVLVPDLRGHPPSGGDFVTYGYLERQDLENALAASRERFGLDASRLGIHSCSAGSTIALEFAAGREEVRALWLESPYADPREMATHYLSLSTGLPRWLLAPVARRAVAVAVSRIRRELGSSGDAVPDFDPLRAAARIRGRICVVYGERDRLVPPRFVQRLVEALPPGSAVWNPAAGHCHHADEPAQTFPEEYDLRWREFFASALPVEEGER